MTIVTSITEVWNAVSTWFVTTIGSITDMFYDSETGLTFLGTLAVFSAGIGITIGVINLIRGWLHSR